jgi:hypothetical protein
MSGKSTRHLYPFHVSYPRTADWWGGGGTWYEISTWCQSNFRNRWEYLDGCFMFETQQDKNWFVLRWSA